MKFKKAFLTLAACVLVSPSIMRADDVSDLKTQMQIMQDKLNEMQEQLRKVTQQQQSSTPAKAAPASQPSEGAQPVDQPATQLTDGAVSLYTGNTRGVETPHFFERKPGKDLTFYTLGGGSGSESGPGQITMYGNFDVSMDVMTKGLRGELGPDGMPPVGNMGWIPDISTNISYAGVRGFQPLGSLPFNFVYQFETQIDIASTSGVGETNSSESNVVKGALTSRNTFLGLSSSRWGSIKFGKTDAPYKLSTMRMNSFYGMVGDYQVIMSNTGGDSRVEFGTRLDHSIWYESPNWGGVNFVALFSPGQNRASNSDNLAAGESDCTGGDSPGDGGITPLTCSDGSWSNAVSASLSYTKGPLYLVAAYERHMKVNRQSDITGLYATCGTECQTLELQDVADEDAGKVGAQYKLSRGTTISGIFETLHRYVPADLEFQNERQRMGSWAAFDQRISKSTTLSFGWAHAFRTPGDPGQHNDSYGTPPDGIAGTDGDAGSHVNNQSNLFSAALRYKASNSLGLYLAWALTANSPFAHFDLGAGGRTVTADCHDASDATGGMASDPHCWTGGQLSGASVGMNWKF